MRKSLLLGAILLTLASPAYAPFIPDQQDPLIPHDLKGTLVTYRVGFAQCSMFLSKEGMAKGTVAPSCIPLPPLVGGTRGVPFEILSVVETEGSRND